MMPIDEINTVCFVGAGTMGCYNSLVTAISGYQVVVYDIDENNLARVHQRQLEFAPMLVGGGYCAQEDVTAALARVTPNSDLAEATASAQLVSESIFERLDVKQDIHRRLEQVCTPETIVTTNSSHLLLSDIECVLEKGNRIAALHTHLGAPLVDIVAGPRTDTEIPEILRRYVLSTGGVPLVLRKEHPGYALNAMLGPVLGAGLWMLVDAVAGIEDIDRAWMSQRRAPMGPFGMMDLFGLNLIHDSWQYRQEDESHISRLRPRVLQLLQPRIDRGDLGVHAGRGFYQYPDAAFAQPGFLDTQEDLQPLYNRLLAAWVGHAILLAAEEVLEPAEIDRAWKVGTWLDTGPLEILADMGTPEFLELLDTEESAGRFSCEEAQKVRSWLMESRGE